MSHPWKINSFKKEMQTKTGIISRFCLHFFETFSKTIDKKSNKNILQNYL